MAKAKKTTKTGLLISVRDAAEAVAAVKAGATLIDVKDPSKGPLGMAPGDIVAEVIDAVGKKVPVSAALGEWNPNILTEACWHLELPLTYIKWGLAGYKETPGWGVDLLDDRRKIPAKIEVVAVAYADFKKAKSIDPVEVAKFAKRYRFKAFLLDTFLKDSKTLLNHMKLDAVANIVKTLKDNNVKVALGGGLTLEAARKLKPLEPDWFAVRGAVCHGNKRASELDPAKVKKWKEMLA